MLVVLLGSGKGLAHGVEYQFRDDATNSIWVRADRRACPYEGLQPGPRHPVHERGLRRRHDAASTGVEYITARFLICGNLKVAYQGETGELQRPRRPPRPPVPREDDRDRRAATSTDSTSASTARSRCIGELVKDALFEDDAAARRVDRDRRRLVPGRRRLRRRGRRARARDDLPADLDRAARLQRRATGSAMILCTTGDATLDESKVIAGRPARSLADATTSTPRTSAPSSSTTTSSSSSASSTLMSGDPRSSSGWSASARCSPASSASRTS